MKVLMPAFLAMVIGSPAFANLKVAECELVSGNSPDKVARVEYVRMTILKSISFGPSFDADHQEVTYVDGCEKLGQSYRCFNPLHDITVEASFDGKMLVVGSVVYQCR